MGNSSTSTKIVENCRICLDPLDESSKCLELCQHRFHRLCLDRWFEINDKCSCPICGQICQRKKGFQPSNGQMIVKYLPLVLSGFENEFYSNENQRTILIIYEFPDGIQSSFHPQPGKKYFGTKRKCFLPNTNEGKEIVQLLTEAFQDQQIFTISQSRTTGQENCVTWNDIHHKTNLTGGPTNFGYPDPTYLFRVREELAAKGYRTPSTNK